MKVQVNITVPQSIVDDCLRSGWDIEEISILYKNFLQQLALNASTTFLAWLQDQVEEDIADLFREDQQLEVGMQVEIINGSGSNNEVGDVGIITEVNNSLIPYRVTVEGRGNAGNWMRRSQVARINY